MLRPFITLSVTAALFGLPGVAEGVTWHVPSQCATIQAGIDSASAGDTVLVGCGTYYEHDIVMKSGICLRSETGQADCVTIDSQYLGRALYCDGVDDLTEVVGFTMTGGGEECGGAFYCRDSSPSVVNLVFFENRGCAGGAVCCIGDSAPTLTNCTFYGNGCGWGGGMPPSSVGGGVFIAQPATATLQACVFSDNWADEGGGIFDEAGSASVSCCNLFSNWTGTPVGTYPSDWESGYPGESPIGTNGNISEDPLYCDPPNGNVGVGPDSPNLPANNACGILIGAVGESCTAEEATQVETTSWSTLKALYR